MLKLNKTFTNSSAAALVTAGAVLSAVMMVAAPAFAEDARPAVAAGKTDIQATYERERAACLAGQTGQVQSACLKEAAAARDEARRGSLKTAATQDLAANAMLRCQRVSAEDRDDCKRMVMGQGTRDGSVKDGAVLTRIDRMIEENPAAAGVPASASPAPKPDVPAPRQPKDTPAR